MNEITLITHPDFHGLPNITFRQLEVFCFVCRESSYANAALELRSTRANVKRVCEDFAKAIGRPLFSEGPNRSLQPTPFAQGLLTQISPLSRSLRRLEDSARRQHEKGRILRFAASGDFFKGGLFTDFLARLQIADSFRPCFLKIEPKRFRTALLNAECDVYFGAGVQPSDRLDAVNLGRIPWRFDRGSANQGKLPDTPADLPDGKWWIAGCGEIETAEEMLGKLHAAGARNGKLLTDSRSTPPDGIILTPETATAAPEANGIHWPCFEFSAVLRKHHPYSELLPRLTGAALP